MDCGDAVDDIRSEIEEVDRSGEDDRIPLTVSGRWSSPQVKRHCVQTFEG